MAFTEVDALTLPDVLDTDLMSAKAVLITDDFKDKTVGDIRDAIKVETIRDGRDGLPTPPTVDNLSEIWYDGRGNLYSVEESFTAATLARGTWSQYTNSNYDGEHGNRLSRHKFTLLLQHSESRVLSDNTTSRRNLLRCVLHVCEGYDRHCIRKHRYLVR